MRRGVAAVVLARPRRGRARLRVSGSDLQSARRVEGGVAAAPVSVRRRRLLDGARARMSVTVVSCVYGDHFRRFVPRWQAAVSALNPAPDSVIVGSDSESKITGAKVIASYCQWRHPQAWHLQQAIMAATTDWVWI